jgi:hypothetical protein
MTVGGLIPAAAEADARPAEQQAKIVARIEGCQNETDMVTWLDCYHEDYRGWYRDSAVPLTKADKKALALTWAWEEMTTSESEGQFVPLVPLGIEIHGNIAIVLSIDSLPANYLNVGDPPRKERWTTVLIRQDSTWQIISEHADSILDD